LAIAVRTSGHAVETFGPTLPFIRAQWHLGVDALIAPFLVLVCFIATAVLVAAPRETMDARTCSTLLLTLASTLGVMESLDLLLLAMFWIASLVPGAIEIRRAPSRKSIGHVFDVFAVLGSCAMVAAVFAFGYLRSREGEALLFDLGAHANEIATPDQHLVFALISLSVLVRKGIIPFHSWLPLVVERGPIGIVSLIAGSHMGAVLILRVLPFVGDAAKNDLPILSALALASALYTALVALGQRGIRRALGFIATSQLAFVLVGLAEADPESMHGALLQIITTGLTLTGLVIIAFAIEARTGTSDTTRLGGLASRFPRMTTAFLLLGLGAIGTPGTLAFVAEDLLLHGLLRTHPIVATLLLVTTVLNGITFLRLFLEGFLGPSREPQRISALTSDLLPRESVALFAIVASVAIFGILPGRLIEMQTHAVQHLLHESNPHAMTRIARPE
jgi:NADH-quinone oxidoreductase subunit M